MRSLIQRDDASISALVRAIEALASHLASHGEARLANVVEDTLAGEAERLPQRFLALSTRGMGGLLDVPLYGDGRVDCVATDERDRLAEAAFEQAKAALGA